MRDLKVALWGFGAMGSGMARLLLDKPGVVITGVCDKYQALKGLPLHKALNVADNERSQAVITDDIDMVLNPAHCDVVIIATDSFVKDVYPKIKLAVSRGINVVTIAEEMAYPRAQSPELAEDMHRLAKENGVTILGTGINPGLMMDLLAVCLTGCQTKVDKVTCRRVNSLSPFGPAVMVEQGIGLTVEAFDKGLSDGTLAGHVGFPESIGMISEALNIPVSDIKQQMSPIVTEVDRVSPHGKADKGQVAGVNMTGQGLVDGEVVIDLIHPQQIEPQLGGVSTGDYIELAGDPPVSMAIVPEVEGGKGTIAMAVNMLPFVVAAKPGLKSMIDMPVPRCVNTHFGQIAFEQD